MQGWAFRRRSTGFASPLPADTPTAPCAMLLSQQAAASALSAISAAIVGRFVGGSCVVGLLDDEAAGFHARGTAALVDAALLGAGSSGRR